MVKSVFQSASLGGYKTELAGNANLLENGSVPSSTENSQRDPGFTGSLESWGIRIENKPGGVANNWDFRFVSKEMPQRRVRGYTWRFRR